MKTEFKISNKDRLAAIAALIGITAAIAGFAAVTKAHATPMPVMKMDTIIVTATRMPVETMAPIVVTAVRVPHNLFASNVRTRSDKS